MTNLTGMYDGTSKSRTNEEGPKDYKKVSMV